jgi:TrmH family RNA methyltransferase
MLSKARIKLIHSLALKKKRSELTLFVVEGKKQVAELLTSNLEITCLVATQQWVDEYNHQISNHIELITVSEDELKKVSQQQAPQQVLAVVKMPEPDTNTLQSALKNEFVLMLDGIQDPGNLGTIIRIADWYGITHIVCSHDCVDVFNPKTIQATMGSFMRISVWYDNLQTLLNEVETPVYGAVMNGTSLYQTQIEKQGILIIGNEGKGISDSIMPFITHHLTIPLVGQAESLNAGIATAIICDARARALSN